jgi:hypothetical protein
MLNLLISLFVLARSPHSFLIVSFVIILATSLLVIPVAPYPIWGIVIFNSILNSFPVVFNPLTTALFTVDSNHAESYQKVEHKDSNSHRAADNNCPEYSHLGVENAEASGRHLQLAINTRLHGLKEINLGAIISCQSTGIVTGYDHSNDQYQRYEETKPNGKV